MLNLIDHREDTKWTVYIHIVPMAISGYDWDKYYVGITSQDPRRRWGKNGSRYDDRHPYFKSAIQKYGWENIEHEIVSNSLTYHEACNMEKILIKKLHSNNKFYGYNMTSGGEGSCGLTPWNKGGHLSKETKEKLSQSLKGRYIDNIWRKNIGEAVKARWKEGGDLREKMSGKNNPMYGKPGYFKNKKGFDNPTSKPVICLNTLKIFGSSSIASEETGITFSDICACCRGSKHTAGKDSDGIPLMWAWYDNYKQMSKQEVNEYIWDKLIKTKYKPIINTDNMELFSSIKSAVLHYGNSNDISYFVKYIKSDKKIYKYNWKYYVDYLQENNLIPLEAQKRLF